MHTELHMHHDVLIAELTTREVELSAPQDALDLFGSFYPEHVHGVIVYEANLPPAFFQLRTRVAGEILQKFVNYRVKLAIVGDFAKFESGALADFIRESNKGRDIFFVATREEAFERLAPAR